MPDARITFRLTPQDETAVAEIREYLRKGTPWVERTAVIRFALKSTLDVLSNRT